MQNRLTKILSERFQNADPTRTVAFRLVDFLIKVFQWFASTAFIRGVGRKINAPTLSGIGYILYTILIIYLTWVIWVFIQAMYNPGGFKTMINVGYAFSIAIIFSIVINIILVTIFNSAAEQIIGYYVNK